MEQQMSYIKKRLMWPSAEQIERLREELHRRISIEELESSGRLGAFEYIVNLLEIERATFHRLWIVPLLDAGLSLEAATACIVQSYFQPN
jgi:hypothetical protein